MSLEACILLLLFALSEDDGTRTAPQDWTVGLRGVGPVTFGMTLEQLRTSAEPFDRLDGDGERCFFISLADAPSGLLFMVVDGIVARADVDKPHIPTLSGAKVGQTVEEIQRIYPGKIRVTSHAYTGGNYLYFEPTDAQDQKFVLVFETDGEGLVDRYRVGLLPAAGWVEGCS